MSRAPVIRKIRIRNFKSIQDETVEFANPLFLVGRNGSGKSNFLEALEFVAGCMAMPLQTVLEDTRLLTDAFELIRALRAPNQSRFKPTEIRLDFYDPDEDFHGYYSFSLAPRSDRPTLGVAREQCLITSNNGSDWFNRDHQGLKTNVTGLTFAIDPGALALPIMGSVAAFAPVLKLLSAMRLYEISPSPMRRLQRLTDGFLSQDGSNVTSVLLKRQVLHGEDDEFLQALLQAVLPVMTSVQAITDANGEATLVFTQRLSDGDQTVAFRASDMSDGTLRVLGMIAAIVQEPLPSVIALEEPELHLHPGALGVVSDLVEIGAHRTQMIVTTHSPELLDAKWIQPENVRIVEWADDGTRIAGLGTRSVRSLQEHLMTTGELLRSNALDATPFLQGVAKESASLFDEVHA